ncbi:MAG: DUF6883 domain-containing protein [Leptolinea sp.]
MKKLRDYCFSASHPRGRHKARVFLTALNISADDAEELKQMISSSTSAEEATPIEHDKYGQRFVVDILINRKGKEAESAVRALYSVAKNPRALQVVMYYRR